MSRLSLFNSPFLLGFEQFEQALDRISKASADGYPPYNVAQIDDHRLRITLAVAGFAASDLQIQVRDNQLVIAGRREESQEAVYLHRGIAGRQFQRNFVLADGIEVVGAALENGLLHVDLERPRVESRVRSIAIETRDPAANAGVTIEGGTQAEAKAEARAGAQAGDGKATPRKMTR
jgi:HSP20 family molecular chaperone IbpA